LYAFISPFISSINSLAIFQWTEGTSLDPHFDANRDYLTHRHYTALLYLNDGAGNDFDGGDFEFCDQEGTWRMVVVCYYIYIADRLLSDSLFGLEDRSSFSRQGNLIQRIVPQSGFLLLFSSGPENLHRLTRIARGKRFTLTVWYVAFLS
jgi:hypothetical protein